MRRSASFVTALRADDLEVLRYWAESSAYFDLIRQQVKEHSAPEKVPPSGNP